LGGGGCFHTQNIPLVTVLSDNVWRCCQQDGDAYESDSQEELDDDDDEDTFIRLFFFFL